MRWLLAFLIVLGCRLTALARPETMTWKIDGAARQALVFAPSQAGGKVPLILVFHGHGGSMKGASRWDLQSQWPQAAVVYLQGLPTASKSDPAGAKPGWQTTPGQFGDRDLKFVDAVVSSMHEKFSIDDGRVFATGFSNGAFFTYLLWAQRPSLFKAFAAIAGRLSPGVAFSEPRPFFQLAGTSDKRVLMADQLQVVEAARQINGAGAGRESADTTVYASSKHAPVVLWKYDGGHKVPQDAPARIVTFFKDQN